MQFYISCLILSFFFFIGSVILLNVVDMLSCCKFWFQTSHKLASTHNSSISIRFPFLPWGNELLAYLAGIGNTFFMLNFLRKKMGLNLGAFIFYLVGVSFKKSSGLCLSQITDQKGKLVCNNTWLSCSKAMRFITTQSCFW